MSGNLEKILIIEVSDNTIWYKFFPYFANVWLVRTNNIYTDLADDDYQLDNIGLTNNQIVISFLVEKKVYKKVNTIAEVITEQSSFYYDTTDGTLLIHFENHKPYFYFDTNRIEIGFALGFYHSPIDIEGEWNNTQYEPRLITAPSIDEVKDNLFNNRQIYKPASVEIDNHDFFFEEFSIGPGVKKKIGNYVRFLMWSGKDSTQALYSEFEVKYQGIIEEITQGPILGIGLRDIRSSLKKKSPTQILDTTDFTDIKDPDKNFTIPQVWGTCYRVPCLCLNEDEDAASDYIFLICSTAHHLIATDSILEVYVNGVKKGLTPPVLFDTDQNFAYFTLPATANFSFIDDNDDERLENMDKVSIDVEGYLKGESFIESDGTPTTTPDDLIENSLAIIREILFINYNYSYTSTYYDISTWESFENDAYDMGLYVAKPTATNKQIEQLSLDNLGDFEWNKDLLFSFSNEDFVSFAGVVPQEDLYPINYIPSIRQDASKVLSNIRVGIRRKWDISNKENAYDWIEDNSNEDDALEDYNSTQSKDYTTLLTKEAQANLYNTRVLFFTGISEDTFTIKIPWEYNSFKPKDWIQVQLDYHDKVIFGWTKTQILKKKPITIGEWMVELECRSFGYYTYLAGDGIPLVDKGEYLVEGAQT